MRTKRFKVSEAIFLAVGLLAVSLFSFIPGRAKAGRAFASNSLQSSASAASRGSSDKKPLAVWQCTSSWYGESFDGLPTATGEAYDMYGATAAHPTLPLGSIVRVVNPRNHRSAIVRINDRGPYVNGRELDVSYQVARTLGFEQSGTARVRVELLKLPSHTPTSAGN